MLLSQTVNKFHNVLSNLFSILSNFFKSCIIFISDILEIFILTLIIFCNFFINFFSPAQTYVKFSKIFDPLLMYNISVNYLNVFQQLFNRTDVFLLFIVFLTFSTSLIMTICKCIKKTILTFALATELLLLLTQEYYKKHKVSS